MDTPAPVEQHPRENIAMPHAYPSQAAPLPALSGRPASAWTVWGAVLLWLIPQVTWAGAITLGSISLEPAAEVKKFWPLAHYLAQQLQPEGIDHGRVEVADSIRQMATFVREGKVDLYLDSPFPVLAVSRLSGSRLLLRRWKKGVADYQTVMFARQDSGISRVEDLQGKMIAFEEPFSSTGYFLPKLVLMQAGLQVVPKREAADPVGREEVGYVFSGTDESTMVWVLRGIVAAGAMDHHRLPIEAKGSLRSLKIIYETVAIPRHIVSARADLPPPLVARIHDILRHMDQSEEGKAALQAFEGTTKFDDIPEHALALLSNAIPLIDAEVGRR
jgi:phosphonate transport system substrate-binding protein